LNPEPQNVCLLVMLPLKRGINVLNPFPKKCLLPWMLLFLNYIPISRLIFRGGNQNKDSAVFHDLFQIEDSQNDPSPTLIIQPENPSFIIPSESGFLDIEKAGPPTVPTHDVPITTNEGATGKKTTALVPFDIVYS
jgi:hypothetical protein